MPSELTALRDSLSRALRGRVLADYVLAPHTTYKIGGPADLALLPADTDDLAAAVRMLAEAGTAFCVLGGGANVLCSDRGVRGVVILTAALDGLRVDGARLVAGAGVPSHQVALAAQQAALAGAEFLAWLPGSLGGACFMNARAFGGEISQVLRVATLVDPDGRRHDLALSATDFTYKRSPFQSGRAIIAEATLALAPGDPTVIAERMRGIEEERHGKHELDFPSCGCVFKNDYRFGEPSGRLIERCGLKQLRIGDAEVSPYHANFVFNRGQARAADVRAVIEEVRRRVREQTGFELELEVQLLGDWA
jgi:UDP-N-acetylmuramate dehydrogenase